MHTSIAFILLYLYCISYAKLTFYQRFLCDADEQERVQKKTFVNWINSYLCQVTYTSVDLVYSKLDARRFRVFCIVFFFYSSPMSVDFRREYRR